MIVDALQTTIPNEFSNLNSNSTCVEISNAITSSKLGGLLVFKEILTVGGTSASNSYVGGFKQDGTKIGYSNTFESDYFSVTRPLFTISAKVAGKYAYATWKGELVVKEYAAGEIIVFISESGPYGGFLLAL